MPHKLLIQAKLEQPEEYRKYLRPREAVRGIEFLVAVSIKNIGDEVFPGGTVEGMTLANSVGLEVRHTEKYEVPVLAVNESEIITAQPFEFHNEGLAWLSLTVKAQDETAIEHFQDEDGNPRSDWGMPVFMVNRELLTIIKLLEGQK